MPPPERGKILYEAGRIMDSRKKELAEVISRENGKTVNGALGDVHSGIVMASFAGLGDVIIAEPKALIGFAGPRVIEQTTRQKLPAGFQRSEFMLEHGLLDMIVHRSQLKEKVHDLISYMG